MAGVRTLTVPSTLDSLAEVNEFVTQAARDAALDEDAIYQVQLAVDEAFANIVHHACGDDECSEVECSCRIDEKGLTVTFRDHGIPFDPNCVPEPDLTSDVFERAAGGLGLFFMNKVMDKVHFEFSPDLGNVLTMVKLREAST